MNKLITPIILIAISAGLFLTFVKPQYEAALALQSEYKQYDAANGNSANLISERDALLKKYNVIPEGDRERLEKLLPDTVDNVRLIIDVNEVVRRYGASLRNIKVGNDAAAAEAGRAGEAAPRGGDSRDYNSMTLGFSVVAPYTTFLKILKDLESSLRIVDVTGITFSAGESDLYAYDVTVKTYWLK
jgi:hypothetical protein